MQQVETDPIVQATLPFTRNFESIVPWMYLDTSGIVTAGAGFALESREEAQSLSFLTPAGAQATAEQIAADYDRVKAMRLGLLAKAYRCPTSVQLSNEVVNTILGQRLENAVVNLRHVFPAFNGYPLSGQIALTDMMYNLGLGRVGPPATGFHEYHHILAALTQTPPDWKTAAANCARNKHLAAFVARNTWTQAQLLAAGGGN